MAGTKTADTRSARRCTGGFSAWVRSTRRTIWASTVAEPVRSTRIRSGLPPLTVPPMSSAPSLLATGMLSPVSSDSSTAPAPPTTRPSVGIGSPGRTRRMSPGISARVSTSAIRAGSPSSRRWATRGWRVASSSMASPALPRATVSRYLPTEMKVTISAATSK